MQTTFKKRVSKIVLASIILSNFITPVNAALLSGWSGSGTSGFGTLAMGRNDDGSTGEIQFNEQGELNFENGVNFFGNFYDSFYINNNGNVTFNGSVSSYTPTPFPVSNQPMIAPFWGDVDTRCSDCGEVYIGSPNEDTLVVTWNEVGFYNSNNSKTNTFQLVLIDRDDTGNAGDFDVEFRYDNIEWTTGSASGGSGGLGGTPAQAGYDAGDGQNFFVVPGSQTAEIVNIDTAPSNTGTPGIWKFAIRNGQLPGTTAENPIMPIINPETPNDYDFEFVVTEPAEPIFIDPDVAVGYDYVVNSGPNIASVILPVGFGDDLYDLWLFDGFSWFDANTQLQAGIEFDFAPGGVEQFRIMGIETSEMLDPTDPTAFVTGLTFSDTGTVNITQTAITEFVDVPEPSMIILFALSGLCIFIRRRPAV